MIDFDFVERPVFMRYYFDVFYMSCEMFGVSFEERMFERYKGDIPGVLKDGEF